jgi:urease accessory protein
MPTSIAILRVRSTMRIETALRLQSWLSPGFPTGAYAYSHALEWAVEEGAVRNCAMLIDWLEAELSHGTLRNDAILFALAHRAMLRPDLCAFLEIARLAAALRGTAELALESTAQGTALLATVRLAWPQPKLDTLVAALAAAEVAATLPIALAAAITAHNIALDDALPLVVQSTAASLVNAAVRLIPLGQSDGQRAIAALEGAVAALAARSRDATIDDLGSAAFIVDIASARHETQYTRLFRS